ncbi:hypothetical protein N9Y92_02905 [Chlamydiales bacterium]|nr:hypothetical protein [Chlamydiales bacterium]
MVFSIRNGPPINQSIKVPTKILELEVTNPKKIITNKGVFPHESVVYAYLSLDCFDEALGEIKYLSGDSYFIARAYCCLFQYIYLGSEGGEYLTIAKEEISQVQNSCSNPLLEARCSVLNAMVGSVEGMVDGVDKNFERAMELYYHQEAKGLASVTGIYFVDYLINQKDWEKARSILQSIGEEITLKTYPFFDYHYQRLAAKIVGYEIGAKEDESSKKDHLHHLKSAYNKGVRCSTNQGFPVPEDELKSIMNMIKYYSRKY